MTYDIVISQINLARVVAQEGSHRFYSGDAGSIPETSRAFRTISSIFLLSVSYNYFLTTFHSSTTGAM